MATLKLAPDVTTATLTLPGDHPTRLIAMGATQDPGIPVLFHLTTPSLPLPFFIDTPLPRRAFLPGIRAYSYFRPGYLSTEGRSGRTVADAATDVEAVLDHFGLDRVVMYGGSGGGPHALASAALLPDRVAGVVVDSSPAPFELLGERAFDGMRLINRVGFDMASQPEGTFLEAMRAVFDPTIEVADPDGVVARGRQAVASEGLPWGTTPAYFAQLLTTEGVGWMQDVIALSRPWGFDLAQVQAPVRIFIGRQDTMTPPAHGRYLAENLPDAVALEYDGDHGALGSPAHHLDVVAQLVSLGEGAA